MPKGGKVDRAINKVASKVGSKSRAIAILKSQGIIKQKGKHLTRGAQMKRGR